MPHRFRGESSPAVFPLAAREDLCQGIRKILFRGAGKWVPGTFRKWERKTAAQCRQDAEVVEAERTEPAIQVGGDWKMNGGRVVRKGIGRVNIKNKPRSASEVERRFQNGWWVERDCCVCI